jgi:hypothetical protein
MSRGSLHKIGSCPEIALDSSRHRRISAKRIVATHEIVVSEVERDSRLEAFKLPAKGILPFASPRPGRFAICVSPINITVPQ